MPSTPDTSSTPPATLAARVYAFGMWLIFAAPDDTFVDRLRKTALTMVFVCVWSPVGCLAYLTTYGVTVDKEFNTGIIIGMCLYVFGFIPMCLAPYLIARFSKERKVSTRLMDGLIFCLLLGTLVCVICWPAYGNRAICFAISILAVVAQADYAAFHCAFATVLYLLDSYNNAYLRVGKAYTLVPDYHFGPPIWEFLFTTAGGACTALCIMGVHFQSLQQKNHVAEAEATAMLSRLVVDLLRKYDTDGVRQVLSEGAEGADESLVASLEAMNANLERYKPFLPNYLFQSGDDDDDDEESMMSASRTHREDDTSSEKSTPTHRSRSDSHSENAVMAVSVARAPAALSGNEPVFEGKFTAALVEPPAPTQKANAATMVSFLNAVHSLAKETRASIHTMVGDRVSLTWNGTSRVVQPELKAVRFVAQLAKALNGAAPSAAIYTGSGHFYSLTSQQQQHAHLMAAEWLGAHTALFNYAQKHNARLLCDRTHRAANTFMESFMVDRQQYDPSSRTAVSFLMDDKQTTPIAGAVSCDIYELVGLAEQDDDNEWMYELEAQQSRCKWAEAVSAATVASLSNEPVDISALESLILADTNSTYAQKSALIKRLIAKHSSSS